MDENAISEVILGEAQVQILTIIRNTLEGAPFLPLQKPIYHFTNEIAPTKGILPECALRAYLIMDLKDQTEIEYALSLAQNILAPKGEFEKSGFLLDVPTYLDLKKTHAINRLGIKQYVTCFSMSEDEATQWAEYGDVGKGFAIAFNSGPLFRERLDATQTVQFIQVQYEVAFQVNLLRNYLADCEAWYIGFIKRYPYLQGNERLRQMVIRWTAFGIWSLAPAMKDGRKFKTEKEIRIVSNIAGFVVGANPITELTDVTGKHYINILYKFLPIAELVRGIYSARSNDDPELRRMLYKAAGQEVKVRRSNVYPRH